MDVEWRSEFIGDMVGMGSTLACKESNVVPILRSSIGSSPKVVW
jgi:hypothetical protein